MAENTRWTHDELKSLLERGTLADLEKLIANPERKHRQEFAHSYAVNVLKLLAESDVLPDDIRELVQRVFELHTIASDPFLGMNLPERKDEMQA